MLKRPNPVLRDWTRVIKKLFKQPLFLSLLSITWTSQVIEICRLARNTLIQCSETSRASAESSKWFQGQNIKSLGVKGVKVGFWSSFTREALNLGFYVIFFNLKAWGTELTFFVAWGLLIWSRMSPALPTRRPETEPRPPRCWPGPSRRPALIASLTEPTPSRSVAASCSPSRLSTKSFPVSHSNQINPSQYLWSLVIRL